MIKRLYRKLLRKLGLNFCYNCGKAIIKPYYQMISESPKDIYGIKVPFCYKCLPHKWE